MAIHVQYFLKNHLNFIIIHYSLLTSPVTTIFSNQVLYYTAYQDPVKNSFLFWISFVHFLSFPFFSIVLHLQSHLFCWQTHSNSVIVVILSIVQTIYNSKDKAWFICELAKCVLLSKLLNKTLTGTIFDFLTI